MYIINANRKIAFCPHCNAPIMQSEGYRYFQGKLIHDKCYYPILQEYQNAKKQTV